MDANLSSILYKFWNDLGPEIILIISVLFILVILGNVFKW
jgi:hypothetical protein